MSDRPTPHLPPEAPWDSDSGVQGGAAPGASLNVLRREIREVRKETHASRSNVLVLDDWRKYVDSRLSALEERAAAGHQCQHAKLLAQLAEDARIGAVELSTRRAEIMGLEEDVGGLRATHRGVASSLVGIVLVILGAVGGWIWTVATIRAEVSHLSEQTGQLREDLRREISQSREATSAVVTGLAMVRDAVDLIRAESATQKNSGLIGRRTENTHGRR